MARLNETFRPSRKNEACRQRVVWRFVPYRRVNVTDRVGESVYMNLKSVEDNGNVIG